MIDPIIRTRNILEEIRKIIKREDDFLITTHIHPDGDSIASVLLFAAILTKYKKTYRIIVDDCIPLKFDFLSNIDRIQTHTDPINDFHPRVVIVLDSASLSRIKRVNDLIDANVLIMNIDHHPSNETFGHVNFLNTCESSTSELVYLLLKFLKVPVTSDIATMVYTGIVCDTGRFLFPNTSYQSMRVCSEMIEKGASPGDIAKAIYFRNSKETIQALASALATLELFSDGKVGCMVLNNGFYQTPDIDTEGFVDHLSSIRGTEVNFFMLEQEPHTFRISFRSKGDMDVNKLAQKFGGGGHLKAAGCTIKGSLIEVKDRIIRELEIAINDI